MEKLIAVVDLTSGALLNLGQTCVYATKPKHLSQRSPDEECLVATEQVDSSAAACTRRY
jgi:hypothetical protein